MRNRIEGFHTPSCPCPSCGYTGNKATSRNQGPAPKPGDIGVCMRCAEVLEYKEDMTLQLAQLSTLMKMDQLQHAAVTLMQERIRTERLIE